MARQVKHPTSRIMETRPPAHTRMDKAAHLKFQSLEGSAEQMPVTH